MNPDSDFVISGATASYRSKTECSTDSQKLPSVKFRFSETTGEKDQIKIDNNYDDCLQRSLIDAANNLNRLSSRICDTLSRPRISGNFRAHSAMSGRPSMRWNTSLKCPELQYLTEPVHPSPYPTARDYLKESVSGMRRTCKDRTKYFPVTLGAVEKYAADYSSPNISLRDEDFEIDRKNNYSDGSLELQLVTPFQIELARLRMERLQLEEEHLLEKIRQQELERIRGPAPKWYELRTPDFTYELCKNNELIRSQNRWQELMKYREELVKSGYINKRLNLTS